MANRQITHAIYNALVVAYREQPEGHKLAAERAGVNWRTARRGWERGWAPRLPWAPAIKDVVANEQKEARARLVIKQAQQAQAEVQAAVTTPAAIQAKAREDALDSRVQEAKLVRASRENTLVLLGLTQPVLKGLRGVAARIEDLLASSKPTSGQALDIYDKLSSIMLRTNEAAKLALQMERLLIGAPTEILGVAGVSDEDAERELKRTLALFEEARKLGVVPSGEGIADDSEGSNGSGGNGSTPVVH